MMKNNFRSYDLSKVDQSSSRSEGGSRVSFRDPTIHELTPTSSFEMNSNNRLENLIKKVSNSEFIDEEMTEKVIYFMDFD